MSSSHSFLHLKFCNDHSQTWTKDLQVLNVAFCPRFRFLCSVLYLMLEVFVYYLNTVRCWRCAVRSTQSWRWLKRRRCALKLRSLTYKKPCCWIMEHSENACCQRSAFCSSEGPSTKCPPGLRIKLLCLCSRSLFMSDIVTIQNAVTSLQSWIMRESKTAIIHYYSDGKIILFTQVKVISHLFLI